MKCQRNPMERLRPSKGALRPMRHPPTCRAPPLTCQSLGSANKFLKLNQVLFLFLFLIVNISFIYVAACRSNCPGDIWFCRQICRKYFVRKKQSVCLYFIQFHKINIRERKIVAALNAFFCGQVVKNSSIEELMTLMW